MRMKAVSERDSLWFYNYLIIEIIILAERRRHPSAFPSGEGGAVGDG